MTCTVPLADTDIYRVLICSSFLRGCWLSQIFCSSSVYLLCSFSVLSLLPSLSCASLSSSIPTRPPASSTSSSSPAPWAKITPCQELMCCQGRECSVHRCKVEDKMWWCPRVWNLPICFSLSLSLTHVPSTWSLWWVRVHWEKMALYCWIKLAIYITSYIYMWVPIG